MAFPEAWLHKTIESAGGCKAYPAYVPRNAEIPFVLFTRQSTERERHLIDQAAVPVAILAVSVYGQTYLGTKQLADRIRLAVDNFSGVADAVTIEHAYLTDEADGSPEFFEGEDVPTYSVEMAFEIRFREDP